MGVYPQPEVRSNGADRRIQRAEEVIPLKEVLIVVVGGGGGGNQILAMRKNRLRL